MPKNVQIEKELLYDLFDYFLNGNRDDCGRTRTRSPPHGGDPVLVLFMFSGRACGPPGKPAGERGPSGPRGLGIVQPSHAVTSGIFPFLLVRQRIGLF